MKSTFSQRFKLIPEEMVIPFLLTLTQLTILIAFHNNYNYFRDELYYIACSDHLDWGFVDHPPLSILILKISRWVFGDSLHAVRVLPAIAVSFVVIIGAKIAKLFGGGTFAQAFASLTIVCASGLIGHGRYFSMNAFDVLFWSLALYILVKIFQSGNQKLWVWFGIVAGLGLQNKYSVGFMIIGALGGMVFTSQRKQFKNKWFWMGMILAGLIFLPHIIWEIVNKYPSLEFMRNASQNKNVHLSVLDFFRGQLRDMNFLNAPIWMLGIFFLLFKSEVSKFKSLGWMYIIVFIAMIAGNAKVYYLSPIYPVLLAGGSVYVEQLFSKYRLKWLKVSYPIALVLLALIALPFAVPVLPVNDFIRYEQLLGITPRQDERSSVSELPQYYADQFGWEEMVSNFTSAYNTLTPDEQKQCVLYVRNYGEAAAIDFYGSKCGLPKALCGHNSYWYWGPGEKTGDIAIIIGDSYDLEENLEDLQRAYQEVKLVATTDATYAMPFENGRQIFVCKGMRTTFQAIWEHERVFI